MLLFMLEYYNNINKKNYRDSPLQYFLFRINTFFSLHDAPIRPRVLPDELSRISAVTIGIEMYREVPGT